VELLLLLLGFRVLGCGGGGGGEPPRQGGG
jgi:hypothetical protein